MTIHITTDFSQMDFDMIHEFLRKTYWSKGIPAAVLKKGLENSLCFAVFDAEKQIGFARMITDKSTFAYLADVFVIPERRGQGVSKTLLDFVIAHPDLQGLRRMVLATADAHGLYEKYGFTPLKNESLFMECWNPSIYQSKLEKGNKTC